MNLVVLTAALSSLNAGLYAVRYAYEYRDHYAGGVFWINAAPTAFGRLRKNRPFSCGHAPPNPLPTTPRTHGVPRRTGPGCFSTNWRPARSLLIVDNVVNPLVLDRPVATTCVPGRLPGAVLFTTRPGADRQVRGSQRECAAGARISAVATRRSRCPPAACRTGQPQAHEASRIVDLLGHLPLAVELAGTASWVRRSRACRLPSTRKASRTARLHTATWSRTVRGMSF